MMYDLTGARQGFTSALMGMPLSCAFLHSVSAYMLTLSLVGFALHAWQ